jgi:hypothetical protein
LTKTLRTNARRKHPTTHLRTNSTNAVNVGANPLRLPVIGKSVIAAKNQSAKSVINAVNLTAAANLKNATLVKDAANRIASTNAKRNRVSAVNQKKLFTTTVANAL